MSNIPALEQFTAKKLTLPAIGTWRTTVHQFDERSAQAIRAALASGRPLLVRGEPGTGKSQLARAAAKVLGRKFLSEVVNAHTEIQDLWYRFDAVNRLAQAQVLSVTAKGKTQDEITNALEPSQFLSPGILWWAFDWKQASEHPCQYILIKPDNHDESDVSKGVVLLIDEIDKADADLPNSLLETLDNGRFTVPWLQQTVGVSCQNDTPSIRPLVVITTNEDRQLPAAFVRRCLVLELYLPEEKKALIQYLTARGKQHFSDEQNQPLFSDKVLEEVAQQVYKDRLASDALGVSRPGQAEYLDILQVLSELADNNEEAQLAVLATIKDFALKKYSDMQKDEPQYEESILENNSDSI